MHHFKKWLGIFTMIVLLSACGESATETVETDDSEPETPTNVEESETTEMDVQEVLSQSIKAMTEINSYSATIDMDQEMNIPEEGNLTTNSTIAMDITQNPLAIHQVINMTIPDMGDMETEFYMVNNEIYFNDATEGKWYTYPEEFTEELVHLQEQQMKPEEQLEILQKNAEHLTLEEKDTHYLVTVESSSANLQELAQELNGAINDELTAEIDQMMSMADIKDLSFTLLIDKETFFQTEMNMDMVLTLTVDGESIDIHTTTHGTFDKFNELEEITIPETVLENAEEFSVDLSEFENMNEMDLEELEEFQDSETTPENEGN